MPVSESTTSQTLEHLRSALGGEHDPAMRGASALRLRCELQPAGGPGAKVMPPTYSGPDGPEYIKEERIIGGDRHACVSLDGVASQANRLEEASVREIDAGRLHLPTIWVDQAEFGVNSALQFSHRLFDAWVEDAELDGVRFGDTDVGRRLARASRRRGSDLMTYSPAAILLGCWASRVREPQGAARLARILTSEIIAVDAVDGKRAAGRLDIHHVSGGLTVYQAKEGRVTLQESEAEHEKKKPVLFGREGRERGKPSAAGYGNVTPQTAAHGGITMDRGLQIATVSLPALRECRFPKEEGSADQERDLVGRTMLAALAMRMLALQVEHGYDLRSGCLLVPTDDPTVELLNRLGEPIATWPLLEAHTEELVGHAAEEGRRHGLDWSADGLSLVASQPQLELLRQSLAQAPEEE